jgi:hypothetical protein
VSRRAALAAALVAALAFAVLLVAAPDRSAIVVGRPGDAPFLTGFGPRVVHRGLPGRWTNGLGVVDLPPTPLGTRITIQLQGSEDRADATVDVFVDGARITRETLGPGRQVIAIAVAGCDKASDCHGRRLALQSTTSIDPAGGEPRGVFVARIGLERGGIAGTSVVAWAAAIALSLGVLVAARAITGSLTLSASVALWAAAALWLFRIPLSPWWLWLGAAAWASAGVGVAGRAYGSGIDRALSRLSPVSAFGLWACALTGLLFLEVFTRGWVFGQPQMLDAYYPWRALLPDHWQNRLGSPFGDVTFLVYPFVTHVRERLLAGEVPLWTASLASGQPFLGAYQAAVFSPLTWIALLVPLPAATVPIALLRLVIGGVGMFVFIRGLGLSRGAAFVAGTAYLLNPYSVVWLEHPPGGVPPWLPWLLHAATRAAEGRRFGPAALAVATTLVLLGGHPHTGVFCVLFASAWAAAIALAQPARWTRLATAAASMVLGAALAAVQIAPFLEYLYASRGYTWRQVPGLNGFAAPIGTAIAALVPRFLGEHATDTYAGRLNVLEQTMYAGIPVLILLAAGVLAARRDWRPWFFAGCGALATLTIYGAPGVLHAVSMVPLLRGATLTRLPIVAITAAIVGAGFGVEALMASARGADRRRAVLASCGAAGALATAILVVLLVQHSFLLRTILVGETWRWSLWAILLAAGTLGTIVASARQAIGGRAGAAALTALVALDLFVAGRGFHPLQPPERMYPDFAELTRLRAEPRPFRVVGAKGALMPNSALVYGVDDIRVYDGLGVAWYADLLDVALTWAPGSQQHELHDANSHILDLLGVRYLFAPPDFAVDPSHWQPVAGSTMPLYRNRREIPRTFLADGYVVATGNDARRLVRDAIGVPRDAVLETAPAMADRPEPAAAPDAIGTARITAYADERVAIDTDAPGRRLLVLSDTWFPGWRATVDGGPVAIARANVAFRAVPLAAGRHRVVFEYAPASFRIGATISTAALLALALWTWIDERRQRPAPSPATAAA